MANYNQINKEQRDIIQYMIDHEYTFTEIGKSIGKDRTSISKEIRRNRYLKSYFYSEFDDKGIFETVSNCVFLQRPPYVCNTCHNKSKCNKHKLYYKSNIADKRYLNIQKSSRQGVDISAETVDEIEKSIVPLIKDKKQSVNQVFINHSDLLFFSKTTFYKYVDSGVFSLKNIDLPKKVKYKQRKKDNNYSNNKRNLKLLENRRYKDYLDFILNHPNMNIVEMDTVIGCENSDKVLLTIIIKSTNFMLIRLLDKKNIASVNAAYDDIISSLGYKLFFRIFRIILTDNGSEFFDPYHLEYHYETKKKKGNVFYCNPYCSWQKGTIEKNHEFIRKIFPKGTSFDEFTESQIKKLEDTINNIPRESLDGETPYSLTNKKFPEFIKKLNISFILPDAVSLNQRDIL